MSDCKAYREEIGELAGVGRLSLEARAHVNACAQCHALEQERASLRRLVRELGRVEAPADFDFRLRARMAASRGGGRNPFRPVYGFAALAASALFLFASASLYVTQEGRKKPGASRQEVLTAEVSGGGSKPRESNVTQASGAGATVGAGPTKTVSQVAQPKMKARAAAPARAREITSREPAGRTNSKGSLDFALRAARTLTIPLGTNAQPLRVVLKDESGQARVVPMRSVSFGSQDLIAREGRSLRAPSTDKEGVW